MTAIEPAGKWGRFPTFYAKVGTFSSTCIIIKRIRQFEVGQHIEYADVYDLRGMSTGCTPKWSPGTVWKVEDDRLFIWKR